MRLTAAIPRVEVVRNLRTVPCPALYFEGEFFKEQRREDSRGLDRVESYLLNARGALHVYDLLLVSLVWFLLTGRGTGTLSYTCRLPISWLRISE